VNIPSQIITLLAGITLTLVSLWYGQNNGLMPTVASDEAIQIDGLFTVMLTVGTGIFILVQSVLIVAAVRYRRRPDDDGDGPAIEGNIPLEIVWTAIPAVLVLGIAIYSFDIYNSIGGLDPMDHANHGAKSTQMSAMTKMPGTALAATLTAEATSAGVEAGAEHTASPTTADGAPADPLADPNAPITIAAAGMQYAWIFTYPDSGVVAGELHVPLNRYVDLQISANDVLHAFWVPEFRLKQDAIPGRGSSLRFKPNKLGEYPVICAELCGAYHGAMKSIVVVQTPAEFNAWIDSQKETASAQTRQAIAQAPAPLTDADYLAHYSQAVGITADTLQPLPTAPDHAHSMS
jgi:cytochrome c oxidase subunit II